MFKKNSFLGWLFGNQESTKEEVKTPKAARTTTGVKINAVVKVMTKTQLGNLTKLQLEAMGRENGIELDRRKTKEKLVDQLHKKLTKKVK